ncbi:hypothetical protein J6590_067657 [Homalodisca vitripennis]|nr:hypothetical protein J6590_067657 [Homalodisca vitripennis]
MRTACQNNHRVPKVFKTGVDHIAEWVRSIQRCRQKAMGQPEHKEENSGTCRNSNTFGQKESRVIFLQLGGEATNCDDLGAALKGVIGAIEIVRRFETKIKHP